MVSELVPTRIHHPAIWVTQCPIEKASCLLPGLAHVAQDHVYISFGGARMHTVLVPLNPCIDGQVTPFAVEISAGCVPVHKHVTILLGTIVIVHLTSGETTSICVSKKLLDAGLHLGGQKVALDGGYAFGWLGRDNVYSKNTTGRLGHVEGHLQQASTVEEIRRRHTNFDAAFLHYR
jgi:hypothetical protein